MKGNIHRIVLAAAFPLAATLAACGGSGGGGGCGEGEVEYDGRCVDPRFRYEPEDRLDFDNVAYYSEEPYILLELPEAPKSGFRLQIPPVDLEPGEDYSYCLSWAIPDMQNRYIYSALLHTTPGLHHSNLLSVPMDPENGPNNYPDCRVGAADPFGAFARTFTIPDVLFANSTQVVGEEGFRFPEGSGYFLAEGNEAVTSIHVVNAGDDVWRLEAAYDFFTMPKEEVAAEVVPFVFTINDFLLPPQQEKTIGSSCDVFGGHVTAIMPHMHEWGEGFDVRLWPDVEQTAEPHVIYDKQGIYLPESDIKIFEEPTAMDDFARLQYRCHFYNDTDHDMNFGTGENEMCVMFGYMSPPENQVAGFASYEDEPCLSARIGLLRGYDSFEDAMADLSDGDISKFLDLLGIDEEDLAALGGLLR